MLLQAATGDEVLEDLLTSYLVSPFYRFFLTFLLDLCDYVAVEGVTVWSMADVMEQTCKGHCQFGGFPYLFGVASRIILDKFLNELSREMRSSDGVFESRVRGTWKNVFQTSQLLDSA